MERASHPHLTAILVFLAALSFTFRAQAQLEGTYQVVIKKQEEKKKSRWTLAEWLTLKQKMRAMDLWLAQNSHSSAFEFYLDGTSHSGRKLISSAPDSPSGLSSYGADVGLYAGVVGLRGSYDADSEKRVVTSGSLNLRLLGQAVQDTHINLEYGIRGQRHSPDSQPEDTFQSQFGGVELAIYLTKHFGIEGNYKRILPASSNLDRVLEGEDSQATIFIDFGWTRVFGNWKKEFQRFEQNGTTSSESREGYGGGLKFFF